MNRRDERRSTAAARRRAAASRGGCGRGRSRAERSSACATCSASQTRPSIPGPLRSRVAQTPSSVRGRHRIERREQRHVDAARDQALGEQSSVDLLPGPVVQRRRAPGDRAQEGDLHETCGRGMDLFIDRSAREMSIALTLPRET